MADNLNDTRKLVVKELHRLKRLYGSLGSQEWTFLYTQDLSVQEIIQECEAQHAVLDELNNSQVIKLVKIDNPYKKDIEQGQRTGTNPYGWGQNNKEFPDPVDVIAKQFYDHTLVITDLNRDKYREYCSGYNLNPWSQNPYEAKLVLKSNRYLVVIVDGHEYRTGSLQYGAPLEIATKCIIENPGKYIESREIKSANQQKNIKQILKGSKLDPLGPLAPFITASPSKIKITQFVSLSPEEYSRIKS